MVPTGAYTAIHRANFWWLNDRCGNVFSERYFFKCLNLSLHSKPFPLGNVPAVLWKLFSALSVQLYETSTLSNYNLSREIFLFYYGSCCLLFFSRKYWSLTMPRSIKSDTAGKLHTSHDSRGPNGGSYSSNINQFLFTEMDDSLSASDYPSPHYP